MDHGQKNISPKRKFKICKSFTSTHANYLQVSVAKKCVRPASLTWQIVGNGHVGLYLCSSLRFLSAGRIDRSDWAFVINVSWPEDLSFTKDCFKQCQGLLVWNMHLQQHKQQQQRRLTASATEWYFIDATLVQKIQEYYIGVTLDCIWILFKEHYRNFQIALIAANVIDHRLLHVSRKPSFVAHNSCSHKISQRDRMDGAKKNHKTNYTIYYIYYYVCW